MYFSTSNKKKMKVAFRTAYPFSTIRISRAEPNPQLVIDVNATFFFSLNCYYEMESTSTGVNFMKLLQVLFTSIFQLKTMATLVHCTCEF